MTVPMPTCPPRSQPAAITAISTVARQMPTDRPVLRARATISESLGPAPRAVRI
ncbi:Uncharacterised protein [Flavonifractor plautii]|uniref:Uncharacterized protein n=1 Tax=Flavonifractor plautii TaxID=292800 RepID=A0A174V0B6_FLAPL|nr:Uncharacterised protein [Flavonifractor plautii]